MGTNTWRQLLFLDVLYVVERKNSIGYLYQNYINDGIPVGTIPSTFDLNPIGTIVMNF
jgi:hypothetical protein